MLNSPGLIQRAHNADTTKNMTSIANLFSNPHSNSTIIIVGLALHRKALPKNLFSEFFEQIGEILSSQNLKHMQYYRDIYAC